MDQENIGFCRRRIAEEERLGAAAQTPEDAAAHFQLALLYKAQLRILMRSSGQVTVGQDANQLAA
jgi:hypothetical protein